jgi:hypothetical protein
MTTYVGIVRSGDFKTFAAIAEAQGWIVHATSLWRFVGGSDVGFWLPSGTVAGWADVTRYGVSLVALHDTPDRDAILELLQAPLGLADLPATAARWRAAETPSDKLSALHALIAMHMVLGGDPEPSIEAAIREALDDPHPVLRLSALRALQFVPARRAADILGDREDPENPGLDRWRQAFIEAASGSA